MSIRYTEGSTVVIDVEYVSDAGTLFAPVAVRYRVDSLTLKEPVVEWSPMATLSTTGTIVISSANNKIPHDESLEERQVVVEMTDSSGYVAVSVADYDIENLQGVT